MLLHFRNRLAALDVEHRQTLRRLVAMQRANFERQALELLTEPVLAQEVTRGASDACDLTPEAQQRALQAQRDLDAAATALQLVKRSQADIAARLSRLSLDGAEPDESDWAEAAMVASSRAAADLLGLRIVDRMAWMPFSHHLRFPVYEQV